MQLFLFLNDLAGRWPLLDEAARLFYIGALPFLGTLVGAQLLLLPRPFGGASRSKTALALVLALALGALLVWGLELVASAWHLGNLSPRPWMTRRVNWMVVEPQDDSFPCLEVLFAFVLASASLLLNHKIGFASVVLATVLALARMFCGNNYFADVAVGAMLGIGLLLLCAALVRRHVPFATRARGIGVGTVLVGGTLGFVYGLAMMSPRFAGKLGFSSARAATATGAIASDNAAVRGAPTLFGEGDESALPEGEGRAERMALAKRSSLFLPDVEAYLRGKLSPLARPLTLLDVEVAPVKAGTTSVRCAAVRFEVDTTLPDARRIVANCAGRLTRATFALDSRMQNVDIICVARDGGRNLDSSLMVFPGDEVPVFTASVQRKNVVIPKPAWLNLPDLDGGMWLRARSRLYINDRALPSPVSVAEPLAPGSSAPAPAPSQARTTPRASSSASTGKHPAFVAHAQRENGLAPLPPKPAPGSPRALVAPRAPGSPPTPGSPRALVGGAPLTRRVAPPALKPSNSTARTFRSRAPFVRPNGRRAEVRVSP